MERRWRIWNNDARTALVAWGGPVSWWWYFMRAAVIASNYIPGDDGIAPLTKFTGHPPDGNHLRVPGCLAYYKVIKPISKMHPRAMRACYLGPCEDQPASYLWDLENNFRNT